MANNEQRGMIAVIIALLLFLPCVYVGSYYSLVDRNYIGTNWQDIRPEPQYRYVHGVVAKAIYRPIHEVDKRVRAGYWSERDIIIY